MRSLCANQPPLVNGTCKEFLLKSLPSGEYSVIATPVDAINLNLAAPNPAILSKPRQFSFAFAGLKAQPQPGSVQRTAVVAPGNDGSPGR